MKSPTISQRPNLLLVDDHTIIREGVKRVLEPIADEWNIIEASTGFQALELLRRQEFRLAIVDLSMPGMSGLDLIKRIRSQQPQVAVLVLSMHAEEQYAMRAFKAGASGFVTKDCAATELVAAVRKASAGGAYVSTNLAERVIRQLNGAHSAPRHAVLSDRELEVLQRIVAGQRLTQIADALHLSVKTVSTHKSRIQEKLQLPTMAALIRYGLEQNLGESESTVRSDPVDQPQQSDTENHPQPPWAGDGI